MSGHHNHHHHHHHHHHAPDHTLESGAQGIRAVKVGLVGLSATALAQILVVLGSGSVALLADTVHNLSDAFTAVPLWIAFALGRRAVTARYPYGYGRAEDLAGLFVVLMIAASAVLTAVEAIRRLLHPVTPHHLAWVAVAGVIGFLGNELVAGYRIRVGRRIESAALVADGMHARADGFTSLAVVAGAGGVAVGVPLADPVVGLLITAAILVVLGGSTREIFRRLMDGVDPAVVSAAETALAAQPGVLAVRTLRMRWIGHRLHADADLDIAGDATLAEAHDLAHRAEHRLTHTNPAIASAHVHAYPPSTASLP